ncbi:gephyrin-like molybdotransferase receptor GlpR [Streptomyces sp. NPDC050738]|uniref:divisome protein SepX/GlpR n=1 Tax=Streptomyces sp. NPDC050738 TaxID=3154744 RepID=UPI003445C0CD
MSSSGLIYAVIVGAWAAYLVPMWLRRQDELNEARPTERFSTAIRLLSGRAGMERRYAKELQDRTAGEADPDEAAPDAVTDPESSVDVRSFAVPPPERERPERERTDRERPERERPDRERPRKEKRPAAHHQTSGSAAERARRTKALARRRRTTVLLFAAFSLGAVVAAVGGLRFLWAPGIPAALLSTYIVHLRTQERRRFVFTMDRRRAEAAAQNLRESRRPQPRPEPAPEPAPAVSPQEAGRRALVEQTDHAEWVDQQRDRDHSRAQGDSWEPVPVPLPTYVTAPVAPRAPGNATPTTPDTWSPTRSSTSDPAPAPRQRTPRRARERGRTPLFDQYDEGDRPRAANE